MKIANYTGNKKITKNLEISSMREFSMRSLLDKQLANTSSRLAQMGDFRDGTILVIGGP